MKVRVVRLLDPPEMSEKQIAQRQYRATAKGKAAMARYRAKKAKDAAWRANEVERVKRWRLANLMRRRAYNRVWQRTMKRLSAEGARG